MSFKIILDYIMNLLKTKFAFVLFLICLLMNITSCYRMPNENDFSVVPTTNNPAVTCEKSDALLPGLPKMGY